MTPTGDRNQRVALQQRGADANGKPLGDWVTPGLRLWARVFVRTSGEEILQQRLQGRQVIQVVVDNRPSTRAVTTAWRLVWKGVAYNITAADPSEDRADIVILAVDDQSDA